MDDDVAKSHLLLRHSLANGPGIDVCLLNKADFIQDMGSRRTWGHSWQGKE